MYPSSFLSFFQALFLLSNLNTVKAQAATPAAWPAPPNPLPLKDRISLAKETLDVLVQNIDPSSGQPHGTDIRQAATLLATMAEYDMLTNTTTYKSTVNTMFQKFASTNPSFIRGGGNSDALRCALAAGRIYKAYPTDGDVFLGTAQKLWDSTSPFVIDSTAATTGKLSAANITFNPICNGSSVEGAVIFNPPGSNVVNGETIGPYIALSSLLYSATSDARYSLGANVSLEFVKNHLSDGSMVYDTFDITNCQLKQSNFTYNAGYFVEGLSAYIAATGDDTSLPYLTNLVESLVLSSSWTGNSGIISEGSFKIPPNGDVDALSADWKAILLHGLYMYLATTGLRTNISSIVQDYISIQDQAIRTNAASNIGNQQIFSPNWLGPSLPQFIPAGQLAAAEVFNTMIGVRQISNATVSPSPTESSRQTRTRTSDVGAIVGGALGGIVLLLLVAGLVLWILRRGRRRNGHTSSSSRQEIMEPFSLAAPLSSSPPGLSAHAAPLGRAKMRRDYFIPSDIGATPATSINPPTEGGGGDNRRSIMRTDSDLLQQVVAGMSGILARMDAIRREEERTLPPDYTEAPP